VTLYCPKLSNCGNLINLTYLFPKYPQHIFFLKKNPKTKKKKTKNIYKYVLGWPATSFGLGWFGHPRASRSRGDGTTPSGPGGGSAAPKPAGLGRLNHPQWPRGWFGRPLGQTLKFLFGTRGGRTIPWATGGGSAAPRRAAWGWPNHPSQTGWPATTYGVVRPP
jgi:hypothetical protein